MPFFFVLIALAAGVLIWSSRAKAAHGAAQELADMAGDVISAARRFGFRRKANIHPVDALEDGDVAIAGAGVAFLELAGLPSTETQDALARSLQVTLGQSADQAREALVLGRWLMGQCGGPVPALSRLTRRLNKLKGADSLTPLMQVLKDVAAAAGGNVTPAQKDALEDIARLYRLK
jgi:hypothetical protein